jgi:AraC-like DNA-binding protein
MVMKRMFEAVVFGGAKLLWDYRVHNSDHHKGYYHWHQCCEMLYVHEGSGRVILGGETFPIRQGMLFFFRPYQLHHVFANVSKEQPYTRTIFYFDPELVDEMIRPFARRHAMYTDLWRGQNMVQVFDLASWHTVIERNYDDYQLSRDQGKGEDVEEIGMMLLRTLDCIRSSPSALMRSPRVNELKSEGYAQEAMQWIDEHYQEGFLLDDLADALHISKFYLSKRFHEETGSTLKEYVTAKRMRQACRLLETTMKSVELIGNEVGIPNASYFVQVFKQEVGTTPLKYRTGFTESMKTREVLKP